MRIGISCVVALAWCTLAPFEAKAQQLARCAVDALNPQEAEARLEWARRCALNKVSSASQGFNVGTASSPMIDYLEVDPASNPAGQNAFQANIMEFEINATHSYLLYASLPTSQHLDGYGFYRWLAASKRQFPYYPQFGSSSSSTSGVALFPHPLLADCNLYTDRSGYNRASIFYVNLYCNNATNTVLARDVPATGLSGGAGSDKRFSVTVPEGSVGLYISLGGGTGNANLYVKRDAGASTSSFDCASTYSGNYDACYFASPVPGTYHVLVKGATSYSGVSVSATWNELQRGSPIYNLYAGWGVEKHYSFYVPSMASHASFSISGGTGDADIYVRYGAPPTVTQYDCRPFSGSNSETCSFSYPSSGMYYVMVRAFNTYSGVSLTANYVEQPWDPCYPQPNAMRLPECPVGAEECVPQCY